MHIIKSAMTVCPKDQLLSVERTTIPISIPKATTIFHISMMLASDVPAISTRSKKCATTPTTRKRALTVITFHRNRRSKQTELLIFLFRSTTTPTVCGLPAQTASLKLFLTEGIHQIVSKQRVVPEWGFKTSGLRGWPLSAFIRLQISTTEYSSQGNR